MHPVNDTAYRLFQHCRIPTPDVSRYRAWEDISAVGLQ